MEPLRRLYIQVRCAVKNCIISPDYSVRKIRYSVRILLGSLNTDALDRLHYVSSDDQKAGNYPVTLSELET